MPRQPSHRPRPRPQPRRPCPEAHSRSTPAAAPVEIRPADSRDATHLAALVTALGYPVTDTVLLPRLERILTSHHDRVLVATTSRGRVVGWIHGFLCQLVEADLRVEIGGLIVAPSAQRRGIGRKLVAGVETWARDRGAREVSVRCQVKRTGAHHFYTALGFGLTKTQHVFRRAL